jgi:CIC family chloride channel protein
MPGLVPGIRADARRMRHIVVTAGNRIAGVLRVDAGLRQGLVETGPAAGSGATLGDLANRNFVVARDDDIVFDVIRRMWRRNAVMAVVVGRERGTPRAGDVLGIITKDHVADSVAASVQLYPGEN